MEESRMRAELAVVGGGPAGVAAVLMAAGLGLRTTLVEAGRVAGKVAEIGALDNVPGGWSDGAALARALAADIDRLRAAGRCTLVSGRALRVRACEEGTETELADGRVLAADAVLVATGVTAPDPDDVPWLDAPRGLRLPPLWRTVPERIASGAAPAVVLGADRPLGTWLRAHPDAAVRLDVLHSAADAHKTEEVAGDSRVRLTEVRSATVTEEDDGLFHVTAVPPRTVPPVRCAPPHCSATSAPVPPCSAAIWCPAPTATATPPPSIRASSSRETSAPPATSASSPRRAPAPRPPWATTTGPGA
ncbi:FAD-dependent oxidoreductase [Streptomyces albus]